MSEKQYLSAQGLLEDSFALAAQVLASGFRPTFMIAVWRGGAPVGIAVQEFLAYHGVETDNIAIRTSSYAAGIDMQAREVKVHGLSYLVKNIKYEDSLLIVDDVFDTGRSIEAIIDELQRLPAFLRPQAEHFGHLVAINDRGDVVFNLQDPRGIYGQTTGALSVADKLYVSSLHETALGIIDNINTQKHFNY